MEKKGTKKMNRRHGIAFAIVLALVFTLFTPAGAPRAASVTKEITTNKACVDRLQNADDEKIYTFTVGTSGYFTISFGKLHEEDDAQFGWDMELCTESGKVLRAWDKVKEKQTTGRFNFKKGTKLCIRVKADWNGDFYAPVGVAYSLKVAAYDSDKWEQEDNNDMQNATLLRAGSAGKLGTLWNETDVDWYAYTVDQAGYFRIRLVNLSSTELGHGWNVSLHDPKGKMLKKWKNIRSGETSVKLNYKKGTQLFLKVEAAMDSESFAPVDKQYKILVISKADSSWEQESRDNNKNDNTITVGKTVHGTMISEKDRDNYTVVADKAGRLRITLSNAYPNKELGYGWNLQICDTKGRVLKESKKIRTKQTIGVTVKKGTACVVKVSPNWESESFAPIDDIYLLKAVIK